MFDIGVKMNMYVNEQECNETFAFNYLKGCLQWQLEHWGCQVLQTNPVESPVHAPSKIGILTNCHHTFNVPMKNRGMDGRSTINFQQQANGAAVNEKYYDEDTGTVSIPVFAP